MYILDLTFILYQYGVCFEKYKNSLSEVKQQRVLYTIKELDNILIVILNKINDIFDQKYINSYNFNKTFPHNIDYIHELIKKSNIDEQEKRVQTLFTTLTLSLKDIAVNNNIFDENDFITKIINNPLRFQHTKIIEDDDNEDEYQVSNLHEYKNNLARLGLPYFDFSQFNQIN